MPQPEIARWKNRPVSELSREELLEVVDYCGREILRLRGDRDSWRMAGDPIKYLRNKVAPDAH